ncbi:MAG TPA: hypothetical protein VKE23_04665 [Candidatus Limnocylindria bacterium]|nr:hypothetical protein [Candidatus Limnocylindria bacterium]
MPERLDDRDLERTLSDIGMRLDGPKRDLWPAVRARIAERRAQPWWSRLGTDRQALAPVAVTLAAILVAAFLLTPSFADALGHLLNIPGVQIFRVSNTPTPTTGAMLTLPGQRVATVAEASRLAGFQVREPAALGAADEIYVELAPVRVTLVYRSRQGLPATALPGISALIVEFKGSLDAPILGKAIGPGTTLEAVPLSTGTAAYWLAGQPHQFFYRDSTGNIQPDTLRLAGNTLLWDVGGITHRLEAQVSREEAVRIASSFH